MYTIKKHFSPFAIKKQWLEFEKHGINIYQSYFVQQKVYTRLPFYAFRKKYRAEYYEIIKDGKTVMIVPLCRYKGTNKFIIVGSVNGFQSFDFIYDSNAKQDEIDEHIAFLLEHLDYESIIVRNFRLTSLVYRSLCKFDLISDEDLIENVSINIGNDYESYFSSLSKHTRQNVRTAYNRVKKEGISLNYSEYINQKIPQKLLNELIELYCDRHEKRYDVKSSKFKRFYLKHFDFSTACLRQYKNFCAVLKLNSEIVAFLSGLINEQNKSIIVPRLSINDEYSRYSPGVILINETAKRIAEAKDLQILDLSKGKEQYKVSMGGETYYQVNLVIKRIVKEKYGEA